jgi:hypothetical protein
MKSIQFSSGKDSLYISHNWRDSGVSAISMLKQESLQQIFGFWFSISHASYLNTRKYMIKSRMNAIIQIVIFGFLPMVMQILNKFPLSFW